MISRSFRGDSELEPESDEGQSVIWPLRQLRRLGSQRAEPELAFNQPGRSSNYAQGLLGRLLSVQASQGLLPSPEAFGQNFVTLGQTGTLNSPSSELKNDQFAMGRKLTYDECIEQCLHLLPSPSGDLQSSEFRQCVGKCTGRL
jgi:hypothetical protein